MFMRMPLKAFFETVKRVKSLKKDYKVYLFMLRVGFDLMGRLQAKSRFVALVILILSPSFTSPPLMAASKMSAPIGNSIDKGIGTNATRKSSGANAVNKRDGAETANSKSLSGCWSLRGYLCSGDEAKGSLVTPADSVYDFIPYATKHWVRVSSDGRNETYKFSFYINEEKEGERCESQADGLFSVQDSRISFDVKDSRSKGSIPSCRAIPLNLDKKKSFDFLAQGDTFYLYGMAGYRMLDSVKELGSVVCSPGRTLIQVMSRTNESVCQ